MYRVKSPIFVTLRLKISITFSSVFFFRLSFVFFDLLLQFLSDFRHTDIFGKRKFRRTKRWDGILILRIFYFIHIFQNALSFFRDDFFRTLPKKKRKRKSKNPPNVLFSLRSSLKWTLFEENRSIIKKVDWISKPLIFKSKFSKRTVP